jgi:putative effector of murein hydrolase LrgA (UPF0299 family)
MAMFVIPQPLFYIIIEFTKLGGNLGPTLYYPNPGAIIGWILLIVVLYTPFFAQVVLFRKAIEELALKFTNQEKLDTLFSLDEDEKNEKR